MKNVLSGLEQLIRPERVFDVPAEVRDKWDLIRWLGYRTCTDARVRDADAVVQALVERERILSTGIGLGIAVPHVRHASIDQEIVSVARVRHGMPFDSLDDLPVFAAFCILMPSGQHRRHIEILGAVALALKDGARRAQIFAAADAKTFVQRIVEASPR